jgi:WD40 repeat protein
MLSPPTPHAEVTESELATQSDASPSDGRSIGAPGTDPQPIVGDRYVIRELIARGGMGEVHLAWDRQLQREVALKTLRADLDDDTLAPRFVFEARVSGQLEHPNIVPVHDFGTAPDGRPFYTMRWIRGRSLGQMVADGKLPSAARRLDVFRKVCDAIAFAHAQGVVHRDLKPNNVMVGEFGEVMVLDWGIARVAGGDAGSEHDHAPPATGRLSDDMLESPLTRAGLVIGTPVFMAPELLGGRRDAMGARIDVYALGVMLYKLLTDVLPFAGEDALRDARAGRFLPPRRRVPTIDRELDAIVCKAMAKAPEDRYASADELRRDVQAHLEGGDVVAFPRSIVGRALRWARRNRRIITPAIATAAIAAIALVVVGVMYTRALAASRDQSLVAERDAQVQAARAETAAALTAIEGGRFEEARLGLGRARARLPADEDAAFVDLAEAFLLHEWAPPVLTWSLPSHGGSEFAVAPSPSGTDLAFTTPDRHVRVVSLPEGILATDYALGDADVSAVGFVRGSAAIGVSTAGRAALVDLRTGAEIGGVDGDAPRITVISADGAFIEVEDGDLRRRFDLETGTTSAWVLPTDAAIETVTLDGRWAAGHRAPVNRAPDRYFVWNTVTGEVLHTLHGVRRTSLDPMGRWIVVVTKTATELRALPSGDVRHTWPDLDPRSVQFRPGGDELVLDHGDGLLTIWSLPEVRAVATQRFRNNLAAVTADGDLLVSDAQSWSIVARESPKAGRFAIDGEAVLTGASADGLLVCIASKDGRVRIFEPWTGSLLRTVHGAPAPNGSRACAFSPGSTRLAQADRDGVLRIWSLESGEKIREIGGNELVYSATFVDDDRVLASWVGGSIGIWNVETGQRLTTFDGGPHGPWGLDLAQDGKHVLTSGRSKGDAIVTLWPIEGGAPTLRIEDAPVGYGARLSPDGRYMAVGIHTGLTSWWSTQTGERTNAETRNNGAVLSVAFTADGAHVLGSSELGALEVWRTSDGARVGSIPLFRKDLGYITPLPRSNTIMTIGGDDEIRLFDLDRRHIVAASTPAQNDSDFAIPGPAERALQLGRLASIRGDWAVAARYFARADEGGAVPDRIEWARAAWASGDRARTRLLLAQASESGDILPGSAQVWLAAE